MICFFQCTLCVLALLDSSRAVIARELFCWMWSPMQAYALAADVSVSVVGFVLLLFAVAGFSARQRPPRFQDPWMDLFCCGPFTATLCTRGCSVCSLWLRSSSIFEFPPSTPGHLLLLPPSHKTSRTSGFSMRGSFGPRLHGRPAVRLARGPALAQ